MFGKLLSSSFNFPTFPTGFSNSILWPLFHYHPGEINFNEDHWEGYQQANLAFADALAEVVQDGDLVWIHDYHLMLLPSLLRERLGDRPNVKIGFFLHTPFPSSEIYRILPVRKQVLLGVLQSDLIGFHTYDYARHFLSSCTRILGLHTMPNGVEFEGRNVHVGTFPIGIDPEKFTEVGFRCWSTEKTHGYANQLLPIGRALTPIVFKPGSHASKTVSRASRCLWGSIDWTTLKVFLRNCMLWNFS
jgi:trehalose-6-phosphate synthase